MLNLKGTALTKGLTSPVFLTSPPGDANRLFIVEQPGRIRTVQRTTGAVNPVPFLNIGTELATGGERGLLGLAFHPDYATNGLFYVNCTATGGQTQIRRYTVSAGDPDRADPASRQVVLKIDQPRPNHNGGWLAFGPDKLLYIATGDGGGANDPDNRAQNKADLLGKMLRIDVARDDFPADPARNYGIPAGNPFATSGGAAEVWAYGLRNPWRNSFDRETGDLFIADVGQGEREELNFQKAGTGAGANYGWRPKEGTKRTPGIGDPVPAGVTDPFFEYTHDAGGVAVIGGYVYRGSAIPALRGTYFYADHSGAVGSLKYDGTTVREATDRTAELMPNGADPGISSFGEDTQGELYILTLDGRVTRIDVA